MRWLLLLLLLTSCGGGGGGSTNNAPTPPPAPRAIDFTFFGQSDPAVTAPFTSVYMAIDWGPTGAQDSIKLRQIAEMQAARARGVDKFILAVSFLLFDSQCNYVGNAGLAAFKMQLDALDLSRSVFMLYIYDEPDVHGCSGATIAQAIQDARNIWPVRMGIIYGPNGSTPGIDQLTDVGRDNYGRDPQIVSIRSDQHLMLICGGADPYREQAQPCVDAAQRNPQVSLVWAFLYVNYAGGKGISNNGMLPAYKAAGCTLTMKCAAGS